MTWKGWGHEDNFPEEEVFEPMEMGSRVTLMRNLDWGHSLLQNLQNLHIDSPLTLSMDNWIFSVLYKIMPALQNSFYPLSANSQVERLDAGGEGAVPYAEGPAKVSASDIQQGQLSAQETSGFSSSSVPTSPTNLWGKKKVEIILRSKETTTLKNSLWSCPRKRSNSRLITQDQRCKVQAGGIVDQAGGRHCVCQSSLGSRSPSPSNGPTDGVMSLGTSFPSCTIPPHPRRDCWRQQPSPRGNLINKIQKKNNRATPAIGEIIAPGCAHGAVLRFTDKGFKYLPLVTF